MDEAQKRLQANKGVQLFRFSYKNGFKVDNTNQDDFLVSPLTSAELNVMRKLISRRDSAQWVSFIVFFVVCSFILITTLSSRYFSLPTGGNETTSISNVSTFVIACLSLSGLFSYFLSSIISGAYFPVGVSIDGVTYLSHLSDLSPLTSEEILLVENMRLGEFSYQYRVRVLRTERPLVRFEMHLMMELDRVYKYCEQR